jgi:hypothetical protein
MRNIIILKVDESDASDYEENYGMGFSKSEGNSKLEKVPETWEELKELCRNSEIQKCSFASDFIIKTREPLTCYEHICIDGIYFSESGEIFAGYESDCISSNRTPAQMWNIIKSLTEQK